MANKDCLESNFCFLYSQKSSVPISDTNIKNFYYVYRFEKKVFSQSTHSFIKRTAEWTGKEKFWKFCFSFFNLGRLPYRYQVHSYHQTGQTDGQTKAKQKKKNFFFYSYLAFIPTTRTNIKNCYKYLNGMISKNFYWVKFWKETIF